MNRYIFIKTVEPLCEKCCFVEDSVAKCNENILKAIKDCGVNCLKIHGYYSVVDDSCLKKGNA
jgi:hypothetical protein